VALRGRSDVHVVRTVQQRHHQRCLCPVQRLELCQHPAELPVRRRYVLGNRTSARTLIVPTVCAPGARARYRAVFTSDCSNYYYVPVVTIVLSVIFSTLFCIGVIVAIVCRTLLRSRRERGRADPRRRVWGRLCSIAPLACPPGRRGPCSSRAPDHVLGRLS
jgi:hypothetical protein